MRLVWMSALVLLVRVTTASAGPICDLRTGTALCPVFGGTSVGYFAAIELQPTGTGVIDSFVRIQEKDTEQGYNTDFRPVQFDEKTDPNHTRDLHISEVGTTTINGTEYATFYLDINEPAAGDKELLTLDQLEIFTTDFGDRTNYSNGGMPNTATGTLPGTTKIFDLDFDSDSYVQLSYNRFGGGSGQSDMAFYLPMDLFTGDYVNLFSQFGNIDGSADKHTSEAGFEEWFTLQSTREISQIPEPGTLTLVGAGLVAVARRYKKRMHSTR